MKRIFLILLFFSACGLYAQSSGWFWQNPLPQGNYTTCLNFFDINTGICVTSDAVLKTNNGGINWQFIYPNTNSSIGSLFMINSNTGYLLVDTTRLLKTTDGGSIWNYYSTIPNEKYPSLFFCNQNIGFIYTSKHTLSKTGNIYRSSNGGLNWSSVFHDSNYAITSVCFPDASIGYATGTWGTSNFKMKFLKTTNSGNSWDTLSNSVNGNSFSSYFINSLTGFVGGTYIVKTVNGGINWTNVLNTNGSSISQFTFVDINTGYALGSGGKIFSTTDCGASWQVYSTFNELGGNEPVGISFLNSNFGFLAGEGGQFGRTTNGGVNWIKMNNNDKHVFWSIKFSDALTGFAGSDNGKLYRTTNGGSKWDTVLAIPTPSFGSFEAISNIGNSIWYVGEFNTGKVYKTTNTGMSWDTLLTNHYGLMELDFVDQNTGFGLYKYSHIAKTTNGGNSWQFQNLFSWWSSNGLDFINANTGFTCGQSTIFRTTNSAQTWDSVVISDLYYVTGIQFFDASTGYLSGDIQGYNNIYGGVMKTIDGGLTWSRCIFSGDYDYTQGLSFANVNTGFALTTTGLFKTINGGANFVKLKTCTSNSLYAISFTDPLNGYCAGSYSTIIKTTTGGEPIGLQPISTEIPTGFVLHQNYPNPFNPVTRIKFQIPTPLYPPEGGKFGVNITLKIYDVTGRQISELVNETLKPGEYEIEWDGSIYSSGVYFYRLTSGDFSQTCKMVLLK